ncbi:MAG TPA: insulinase family protein [bacterium]|nr:insulinase family protein [bacterium]
MNSRFSRLALFFILLAGLFFQSCSLGGYKVGQTYHGFKLVKKEFVEEVNSQCYYFEHVKSGARLLKIANDDPNKTFCATFKTLPRSDSGTPHIMEHSVLNGSKNFPVKSPFDVLTKGSLNTFLNAMTGGDITLYPVASMNDKDFRNLMHVYLDAVFFPNIYRDPRILKQEGWHYELESKDKPVIYKGVVYNEMKGAFSNPSRQLNYYINKNLFPDNCYGYSSGGYPEAIPDLTYEKFLDFHRTFYHPTNSYLYLYGNSDIESDLKFINSEYLSQFEKLDKRAHIKTQEPFSEMKKFVEHYPVSKNSETDDKTFLAKDWVIGKGENQEMGFYLDILAEALVNHESGPIKLALQEAGIGKDIHASSANNNQNVFQITVKNANPDDLDKFNEVVDKTLSEVAQKGIDKNIVKGIVNRMEFRLREGDNPQKGLTYLFHSLNGWFYAEKPFLSLKWEKPLASIKKGVQKEALEELIKTEFLNNDHSLILALAPKPGLQSKRNDQIVQECADYKASLSDEEIDQLVQETKDLIAYQQEEDKPEDLATIPMLSLDDIGKEAQFYRIKEKKAHGQKQLHYETFTNNILYSKLMFDARVLEKEQLPYLALLAEILGKLNTENYNYGELDNQLNMHTGGFSTYLTSYLADNDDDKLRPKIVVSSKATNDKSQKMLELTSEILTRSKIDDKKRLKTLLTRYQARQYAKVMRSGMQLALTRVSSYYSKYGQLREMTAGYSYYRFITDLTENYDQNYDQIVSNLKDVAKLVFNKNNLVSAITCTNKDLKNYNQDLPILVSKLDDDPVNYREWNFEFDKKNEGLMTPSEVQYVVKAYDFKDLGYDYNGKMRVLNQILSRDWLTQQLRVIGGAYGGFAGFSRRGNVYFASYRDPNLKKTLDNIDQSPEFLKKFDPSEDEMTRFIIGTISKIDEPLSPSQEGSTALKYYMAGIGAEDLQSERDAVLNTTAQDIRDMQKFVKDILDNSAICVYGNEEKIQSQKDIFKNLIEVK